MQQAIPDILRRHWGFSALRPLQEQAVRSILDGRDTVVVLPTGGGKSLCYQVPALVLDRLAIVVTPLISLMQDQVSALHAMGVEAECLHSGQPQNVQHDVWNRINTGIVRLLYVSPERFAMSSFQEFVERANPAYIAIDEAHCISTWGHDFRPEYRQIALLRQRLPQIPMHAFTATATREVRADISTQLEQRKPNVIAGSFDRPNLYYEVRPKQQTFEQVLEFVKSHKGESGIIYCLSRKDVETYADRLSLAGVNALAYHAGMDPAARHQNQEAFRRDDCDVMVATIAFGMGIDKPDVRYVIHTSLPKSLENYQQEIGRAGRDGLAAHCLLFYSAGDIVTWEKMHSDAPAELKKSIREKLNAMKAYCTSLRCRRVVLLDHFGESYHKPKCSRCDRCARVLIPSGEAQVIAQKVLSCVKRLDENQPAPYIAKVLHGTKEKAIRDAGHDQLSTFALLDKETRETIAGWIEELVDEGYLEREHSSQPPRITARGWEAIRGRDVPLLSRPLEEVVPVGADDNSADEAFDRDLFEALRAWRHQKAHAMEVPPYIIFGDRTLKDLARVRPTTLKSLLNIQGIGEKRCEEYGAELIDELKAWYDKNPEIPTDCWDGSPKRQKTAKPIKHLDSPIREAIRKAMTRGTPVEELATQINRAPSTTWGYILDFLQAEGITMAPGWISEKEIQEISDAHNRNGTDFLRPLFDEFNGRYSYEKIKMALTFKRIRASKAAAK